MSHNFAGLWRMPEASGNRDYADVNSWVEVAKIAEEAKFDAIFLADGLGAGGYFEGDLDTPINEGMYQRMDPSALVAALSMVTENLGFVITSAMIQDHPFHFARRMSTLDHISKGRVGWNVVTSFNPGSWLNLSIDPNLSHEERYRWAEEYMDVVYKLWEGSWESDAGLHDIEANRWADASKVHEINHAGERYSVKGPHMVEPSPQGSPMIFQAGASPAGKAFAAMHAEMQFMGASNPAKAEKFINEVRAMAAANGRAADEIKFAPSMTFVIGSTEEEAERKRAEYNAMLSFTGLAAKLNNQLGIDFSKLDPNTPLSELKTNGITSYLEAIVESFPAGYTPSLEEVLRIRSDRDLVVGTPEQIADQLEALFNVGVDGVLVSMMTRPGSLIDFAEQVMPVLQERGIAQKEYSEGTLRDKMFAAGSQLPSSHPAAKYRHGVAQRA
jgi:FMN-dependent oxidoreductase (nitrilotriacetate monooxygenase family)